MDEELRKRIIMARVLELYWWFEDTEPAFGQVTEPDGMASAESSFPMATSGGIWARVKLIVGGYRGLVMADRREW